MAGGTRQEKRDQEMLARMAFTLALAVSLLCQNILPRPLHMLNIALILALWVMACNVKAKSKGLPSAYALFGIANIIGYGLISFAFADRWEYVEEPEATPPPTAVG